MDLLKHYPWLTEAFIQGHIERSVSKSAVSLKQFNVGNAVGKGENYCSNLFRISVTYVTDDGTGADERNINFVLKAEIPSELHENDFELFPREIFIYNRIVMAAEALLSVGNQAKVQVAPR